MGMQIPNDRDRAVILAMLDLKRTARGPGGGPIGVWLVKRAKQMWPRFAGLKGPSKTNVPWRYNVLAYHHPAQLCWEWFWSISFNRRDVAWRSPTKWFRPLRYNQAGFVLPFLFEISFHRQDYGYMLSSAAENRLRAYALEDEAPHD